ncbi:hypothetical protein [Thiolapillus sp.]
MSKQKAPAGAFFISRDGVYAARGDGTGNAPGIFSIPSILGGHGRSGTSPESM